MDTHLCLSMRCSLQRLCPCQCHPHLPWWLWVWGGLIPNILWASHCHPDFRNDGGPSWTGGRLTGSCIIVQNCSQYLVSTWVCPHCPVQSCVLSYFWPLGSQQGSSCCDDGQVNHWENGLDFSVWKWLGAQQMGTQPGECLPWGNPLRGYWKRWIPGGWTGLLEGLELVSLQAWMQQGCPHPVAWQWPSFCSYSGGSLLQKCIKVASGWNVLNSPGKILPETWHLSAQSSVSTTICNCWSVWSAYFFIIETTPVSPGLVHISSWALAWLASCRSLWANWKPNPYLHLSALF